MIDAETVTAMRAKYRALVVEWDEARDTPKGANPLFDALHLLYKELRESEEGRQAITGLLDDPIAAVQLSAASHSLALQPERAVAVLEELEQGASLHAVTAKWTLRSYRNGKLDLDW
jgi:Domain of unknown function (DUF2019)